MFDLICVAGVAASPVLSLGQTPLRSFGRRRDSVNQANALLRAITNPRSGEIDLRAESTFLDSGQFSLAQSSRGVPG